jgi:hypothetical protein
VIARKPLYAWRMVAEAVAMACRSSALRLNLLGRIILKADARDEMELRLQPLDVLLALNDQVLEEFPRAGIALLQTEGDPLFEWGQGTRFQLQIPRQQILEVLTDMHMERLVQHRHPLQEEDPIHQPLGMAHFLEGFRIDLLIETQIPPVLTHQSMEKILVDGRHFPSEDLVKLRDDFR